MAENRNMSSEMNKTQPDIQKLEKEIQQLQQDNKALQVRAQGIHVLGKVLQDSQEENIRLKSEIDDMKEILKESGVGGPYLYLSRTDSENPDRTFLHSEYGSRYSVSSSSSVFYHPNVNPENGNLSDTTYTSGLPSIFNGDLHVKDVHTKLQHLKMEYEELTEQAKKLMDSVNEDVKTSEECNADVQVKLGRLCMNLETNRKEARTRETLARVLALEEKQMKKRLQDMEAEQTSYETAIAQLEIAIAEGKAEFENLKDETNTFKDMVLVKQSDASNRNSSSSCTSASVSSGGAVEGAVVVKSAAEAVPSGGCSRCDQLQRQSSELQRQLEETRNERDEAVRQKEEILDVNHAWDTQYRKLQGETMQEINDLKQQNEILKAGDQTRKFDKIWITAKNMVDGERKAKEQIAEEKKVLEEHIKALEKEKEALATEVEQGKTHIYTLQQQLHLFSLSRGQEVPPQSGPVPPPDTSVSPTGPAVPAPTPFGHQPSPEIIDQIEALKQQLRVYATDFQSERSDRERMQSEKDRLKEELDAVKQQVLVLEQQVRIYEDDFNKERREKEELKSQMRAGSHMHGGVYQPHLQDVSRRVQSVAEQQAKVNAIREVHDREQRRLVREQQELQQQTYAQQQHQSHTGRYSSNYVPPYLPPSGGRYPFTTPPQDTRAAYLRARGPADEMFRGGEVFPDLAEDVVDSASANSANNDKETDEQNREPTGSPVKECPRCLRAFKEEEAMIKHIEKCIP